MEGVGMAYCYTLPTWSSNVRTVSFILCMSNYTPFWSCILYLQFDEECIYIQLISLLTSHCRVKSKYVSLNIHNVGMPKDHTHVNGAFITKNYLANIP